MSKSYRYDPEEGGAGKRPRWKRNEDAAESGALPESPVEASGENRQPKKARGKRGVPQEGASGLSPEWAMELMKGRINTVLSTLARRGVIAWHEKEDYEQILNIHICRMAPFYDSERTGWNERKTSALRYLNVVVNSAVASIVRHSMFRRRAMPTIPIPPLRDEEDRDDDAMPCDLTPYEDRRRPFDTLWLGMDIDTMAAKMEAEERMAFFGRLEGCTFAEVADGINAALGTSVDRFHVMNVTMEKVRKTVRDCGYGPKTEGKENHQK